MENLIEYVIQLKNSENSRERLIDFNKITNINTALKLACLIRIFKSKYSDVNIEEI